MSFPSPALQKFMASMNIRQPMSTVKFVSPLHCKMETLLPRSTSIPAPGSESTRFCSLIFWTRLDSSLTPNVLSLRRPVCDLEGF